MGPTSPVPFVDPRTIVLLTGVMGGLMAVVLYFLQRNYPPTVRGLAHWAAGTSVLFLAGLTAATRGLTSDLFAIAFANLLIFSGVYLQYFGSQQFLGLAPRFWPRYGIIIAMALLSTWFLVADPQYRIRLMISIAVMTWLFSSHAYLILTRGGKSFAYRMAFVVLVCSILSQVLRFATAWLFPVGTGILDNTPQNLIYVISYPFLMLLTAISLVLMATDRVRTEFEHLASHDSLTNALSRRNLTSVCQQELERCHRHGRMMSVLLIEIDHFKSINDNFGHQAGDRALVQFVQTVTTLLRRADVIGRLGGEEFVVVLPETQIDVALVVAERIRRKVSEMSDPKKFTVSIGVTTNQSSDDSVDDLMARADRAMYQAKQAGRDQVIQN
jgi:diguanylate cyclase (GGDEF)-like protein